MGKKFCEEARGQKKHKKDNLKLPKNFVLTGQMCEDDIALYIKQDVYNALDEYSASDTDREKGAMLIGEAVLKRERWHVVISDFIEARHTDATAARLTFTHETWADVHKEHAERCPEKKIVGWQHTHPGYGIFLSNYDMFIHENFFDMPYQVAYVIDPVKETKGFFAWRGNKVEALCGYRIYDEKGVKLNLSGVNAPRGILTRIFKKKR